FQALQTREEIVGAAQRHGEIARVLRPLLAVSAEAVEQVLGKLGIAALALPQLLAQAALDHAEVAFQRVQVEARQRPQAFTQTFTLRLGQRRAGDARGAVVTLLLQAHAFARQLR